MNENYPYFFNESKESTESSQFIQRFPRLIKALRGNQKRYGTIRVSGKKDEKSPQREYDLYEEYFKYPVDIKEYRQEGGRKKEVSKAAILKDYKDKMTKVYDKYKDTILVFVNRA